MDVAALAIAILALVLSLMALPTVFQMWWGAPDIRVDFDVDHRNGTKYLKIGIRNEPVRSRVLRKLGVTRQAVPITAAYRIYEVGSNRIVVDTVLAEIASPDGSHSQMVNLPAPLPVGFVIIQHDADGVAAIDLRNELKTPMTHGRYRAEIEVLGSDQLATASREFTVGANVSETYWQ
jgi:hypothetical protein